MRIVHVVHRYYPNVGGVEKVVRDIAEHQAKNNEVIVITGDMRKGLKKYDKKNNVRIIRLKSFSINDKYFINFSVRKKIKDLKPDIVHVHSVSNLISFSAMTIKYQKLVFTPYEHRKSSSRFNDLLHFLYAPVKKFIFKKADFICCLTEEENERISRKYGISRDKIRIINPIIEIKRPKAAVKSSKVAKKNKDTFNIIFIGRLEKYKGIGEVMNALQKINSKKHIKFTIIGKGPYEAFLKNKAKKFRHLIEFKPFVENISDEIAKADLLVNYSSSESFGMVVMEALLMGVPVLMKEGPLKIDEEFVVHDEKSLKKKIEMMINKDRYREKMNNKAAEYIRKRKDYSALNVNKKLIGIYTDLLNKKNQKKKIMFLLRFTHPDRTYWCPQIMNLSRFMHKSYDVRWSIDSYSSEKTASYCKIPIILNKISKKPLRRIFLELMNIIKKINQIKKYNPDIIFVRNDFINGLIGLFFKICYSKKLIFNLSYPIYDSMILEAKKYKDKRVLRYLYGKIGNILIRPILKYSDVIVAISPEMKKKYFSKYHDKTLVLPMSAEVSKGNVLSNRKNQVIYHGSLDRLRNIEFLIDVMSRLMLKSNENIKLIITGDGNDRKRLEKLVKDKALQEKIIFKGNISRRNIHAVFSKCRLGLSPLPPDEIFKVSSPTKTFEYLAEGLPVIATDIPEHRKLVDNSCGFVLNYDADEFASAIKDMIKNKKKWNLYSRNAIEYIKKKNNYESNCSEFIEKLEAKI